MAHPNSGRMHMKSLALVAVIGVAVISLALATGIHAWGSATRDDPGPSPKSDHRAGQIMRYSNSVELDSRINPCGTSVYYTSYPAKCRSADGTLIQVRTSPSDELLADEGK